MDIKEIEKYLDKVILDCDDPFSFSILNTLRDNNHFNDDIDPSVGWYIADDVKKYGITKDYLELVTATKDNTWVKLSSKGLEARKAGGFFKFEQQTSKEKAGPNKLARNRLYISIIFGIIGAVGVFYGILSDNKKTKLEQENIELQKQVDSLMNISTVSKAKPMNTIKTQTKEDKIESKHP